MKLINTFRENINILLDKKIWKFDITFILLCLSIFSYTVIFSLFTIYKHKTFNTYAWDLGIFNQAFWTTTKLNKIFYYTAELYFVKSGSFFGVHFSPILYLLVPFYSLYPHPETLLILQSLILGIASYPIYLIGKKLFNKKIGLYLSILYLLNPIIHGVNSYDFHVLIFFPLFSFLSFYYYIEKKWIHHILTVILCLMVQEQITYIIFSYAIYQLLDNRKLMYKLLKERKIHLEFLIPIIILLISILWYFLSGYIISIFNPVIPKELKASQHFVILGVDEPKNIPIYIIKYPYKVVKALSFDWYNKILYLMLFFIPFLFLPLL